MNGPDDEVLDSGLVAIFLNLNACLKKRPDSIGSTILN